MKRWIWLPVGLVVVVALLVAATWAMGAGDGGGSEGGGGMPPAEEASISAEQPEAEGDASSTQALTPAVEDKFSPVVLSHRGRNYLLPGEIIEGEGFEFVLGAVREDLEQVASVTVRFPDGETTRQLFPSTQLGVPLDFFGYYGTGEGLPPAGDYVFEIVMKDGTQVEVVNEFGGRVLELPDNVSVEIDREAGTVLVTWDPVEGVRQYTVDLYEVLPGGEGYTDEVSEVGCPDPEDPSAWLTATYCTLVDLNSYLEEGKEYGIRIAVWSDFSYGGVDGAVLFTW